MSSQELMLTNNFEKKKKAGKCIWNIALEYSNMILSFKWNLMGNGLLMYYTIWEEVF